MTPKNLPNGTAETPTQLLNSFAPVVGINFGNSFASIAVLTKVKKPSWVFDSMANLICRKDWRSVSLMRMESVRLHALLRSKGRN